MSYLANLKRKIKSSLRPHYPTYDDILRLEWHYYIDTIQKGMTVFDVGAHLGEQTLFFHHLADDGGQIHAFEPTPTVYDKLKQICALSAYSSKIMVNQIALSDHDGTLEFHVYDENNQRLNTAITRNIESKGKALTTSILEVPAMTLDTYCMKNNVQKIDFIKIDVEGAEFAVLKGAEKMLAEKRIQQGIFEFGNTWFDVGVNPADAKQYLERFGYRLKNVVHNAPIFPMANPNTAEFAMIIFELER